jgi:hypothetical protein
MTNRINPPKQLVLPDKVRQDVNLKKAFDDRDFILFQIWKRLGGGDDLLDDINNTDAGIAISSQLSKRIADLENVNDSLGVATANAAIKSIFDRRYALLVS